MGMTIIKTWWFLALSFFSVSPHGRNSQRSKVKGLKFQHSVWTTDCRWLSWFTVIDPGLQFNPDSFSNLGFNLT